MSVSGPSVVVHDLAKAPWGVPTRSGCYDSIANHLPIMATIQSRIASPKSLEEAESIVQLLITNLARNYEIVRDSLYESWDVQGCHHLAQALKGCYYYSHGHVLGASLRTLANTAIMREHRLAQKL